MYRRIVSPVLQSLAAWMPRASGAGAGARQRRPDVDAPPFHTVTRIAPAAARHAGADTVAARGVRRAFTTMPARSTTIAADACTIAARRRQHRCPRRTAAARRTARAARRDVS